MSSVHSVFYEQVATYARPVARVGQLLAVDVQRGSTPNLAYWLNRIMLLLGISPFFSENSSQVVLGWGFRRLCQGTPRQGHLRLLTHPAMLDLLARERFPVRGVRSVPVWKNMPGDRLLIRLSPNRVYLLEPPSA
ncbi:MAG: hypothetical protein JWR35_3833 [Marmoricola sp.]|nr:hypothetical protein [Marmoricola sp.]